MKKIFILLILIFISINPLLAKEYKLYVYKPKPNSLSQEEINAAKNNRVFTVKKPVCDLGYPYRYSYSMLLNDDEIIVAEYNDKTKAGEYYIHDIESGKITPIKDKIIKKSKILGVFGKDKLVLAIGEGNLQKLAFYDCQTKAIKYFKGHIGGKHGYSLFKLDDKTFVSYFQRIYQHPSGYEICDIKSMTCKNIESKIRLPLLSKNNFLLDDKKILTIETIEQGQEYTLFDILNQRIEEQIIPDKKYTYYPKIVMYKKNNFCLLKHSEKRIELNFVEYKDGKFILNEKYLIKEMPKNITHQNLLAIDENRLLIYGGENFSKNTYSALSNDELTYSKNAYIFNIETKTLKQIESLPVGINVDKVIELDDNRWLIKPYNVECLIIFNKKGLDD